MSYYYKYSRYTDHTYDSDGDIVKYNVTSYDGPYKTLRECVNDALKAEMQDFEVIYLP